MKCNATCISALNISSIDATTIEVRCAIHGAYYMFKNDDDAWESGDARKKRMAEYRICENPDCGAEYQIKDHPYYIHLGKTHCPACVTAYLKGTNQIIKKVHLSSKHDTTWSRYGISVR